MVQRHLEHPVPWLLVFSCIVVGEVSIGVFDNLTVFKEVEIP